MKFPAHAVAVILFSVPALVSVAVAGPLVPPPGPVSPTKGPEPRTAVNAVNTPGDAADQFKITEPGSYHLESNITIQAGKSWGVAVLAPGVTLDLNGFTIDGNNGVDNGGIRVDAAGVVVRNGTIRNVYAHGVAATEFPAGAPGMTVENIRVLDVSGPLGLGGFSGIRVGRGAIVRDCYVNDAAVGISAGFNANISGCTVEFARGIGMSIEGGSQVSECVVVGTVDTGSAFRLGAGCSVQKCVARSNAGAGFVDQGGCAFTQCGSSNNAGGGFVGADNTLFDGCHAVSNTGAGFVVSNNSRLVDSHASGNSGFAVAINGGDNWEISRCSFVSNGGGGISLSGSAVHGRVSDCNIRGGGGSGLLAGVRVASSCEDIVVANCAFGSLNRGVELEGLYCRVTNNSFNNVSIPVAKADGTAPNTTNLVGPIVTSLSFGTASHPFSNTSQ